ncbi:hypothetical protein [Aestuariivirga sp.]|uniref:hypothetical protein n=1 Tax=Aestuariivirga sp. TaxID=2650926 RepID=UPI0025C5BD99|nr:hypothetical protein [Aestuariivirga sp.]MCA3554646.1 hypothetical protein [Aestuariivirga sp.]
MPPREVPPRVRPTQLEPGDFDAIREAVMETPRGRWFLDEFSARLRRAETSSLRYSMRRLETAIAANHDEIISRLAAALREDAAEQPPVPDGDPEPRLRTGHMTYFRADEDIFEPAPEAATAQAPRLIDIAPSEPAAPLTRRRIIITRRKPGEAFDVPLADELPKAS